MANHAQRRLREKNELRLKILEAARELFTVGGEAAVTLRGVAEKIEYSATTIYQHFTDKDALLRELCAADFLEFGRALKQAERLSDPMERLRRIATAYVDFGLQFPGHYRLMFLPSASNAALPETPGQTGAGGLESGPYGFFQAAVFKAMAAGCFKPEHRDVASIAQLLWSGLHGVVALHLVRAKYPDVPWKPIDTAARLMVDCLFVGLLDPRFIVRSC